MHGSNFGSNFEIFDGLTAFEELESILDHATISMECSSLLVKSQLLSWAKPRIDLDDNRRARSAKRPDCIAKPQARSSRFPKPPSLAPNFVNWTRDAGAHSVESNSGLVGWEKAQIELAQTRSWLEQSRCEATRERYVHSLDVHAVDRFLDRSLPYLHRKRCSLKPLHLIHILLRMESSLRTSWNAKNISVWSAIAKL